ncbi:HAD-IC family P-type ATPase [Gardnerella vaginalis]|uniref:E1-E2 ATPase n=1 Tax=Gardnerella vaginalis (strain ATCC 14019 / 317) TaxID=525284 RepID=E3D8Z3_GARV3|nr:HAD-IC family P-type ATPase [Gardnerella vaginalis]ADP38537.1 E1-E2 ATPase [Gardnerella vaginalis ATCC 14019]TCH81434.1 HAD family hydrolase [Gardnerella vaginalis]TCH82605.1 HAD family hydrolase [Gardnerella vaginalis ATCC 14018 = JCM 11026]SDR99166.1 cation-transporting ATPase E [Gardnerella vaginalis]VEH16961.1 Calcium-transporting ATPase lmo0841 [Gardnerella vaginalis]
MTRTSVIKKDLPDLPEVDESGLNADEVSYAVENGDVNITTNRTSRSVLSIVRANVFTLFNAIIFVAMVVVLATGSWKDAVFGFVILINTGIGVVTELRAKHTLDRLSILVASRSIVRRGGKNVFINHCDIVLGDLLWVRAGDQVPADVQVLESWGLEMDESMLTGESATVRKSAEDRVYSGSTAVSGVALARVTAVGGNSYAARLAAQAKVYTKTISDLSRGINTILKWMTIVVVPLCALLVWSQISKVGGFALAWQTGNWRSAVVSAVAGVVGMIPEGLVLLTSLNFAVAAMRLARKKTLIQELESVETLARVDCLNLDKTGTITDGGIAFVGVDLLDDNLSDVAKQSSADAFDLNDGLRGFVNQALFDLSNEENPNATGIAIMEGLGSKDTFSKGLNDKNVENQGVFSGCVINNRLPFSSSRKWSAINYKHKDGSFETWYMGAPEVLVSAICEFRDCSDGNSDSNYSNMRSHEQFDRILHTVNEYAQKGERVLLLALDDSDSCDSTFSDSPTISSNARPVALVRCSEKIRSDARQTLAWFRKQGVRCRVISGDNPITVAAVAEKVGLTGDSKPVAMDARNLPKDVNQLSQVLENVDVLGRVLPDQKKAIVQALHAKGHVVAMTGDGVNDTLALKEADLGVAMGNAAPAAKAVAQVVLVDSRFSHLPDVVARGRQVMANMERVAGLFLVKTVYSALISAGVVLLGLHFPYLPRHITYIGSLTIGIPAFLLALAPNSRRYIPGFLHRVVRFALPNGVAVAISVLVTAVFAPMMLVRGLDASGVSASKLIVGAAKSLDVTRSICAVVVFALGVVVLATVSKPIFSWRGIMVLCFALAGVVGAFIPFVAHFFDLHIPTNGNDMFVMICAVMFAFVVWMLLHLFSRLIVSWLDNSHSSDISAADISMDEDAD